MATLVAPLAACGGGAEAEPEGAARGPAPPTVLLVSLDTVRADRLGAYGHERDTTPVLSALAEEAVVFETVAAQASQTLLSHKSLFASKYPVRLLRETTGLDMEELATARKPWNLLVSSFRDLTSPSLVGDLQRAGYATAAFTDAGWMRRTNNFQEGFDHYRTHGGGLEETVPALTAWLDELAREHPAEPTFLFLHTYDAHCPYPCREPMNSLFCADHAAHLELEQKCAKTGLLQAGLGPDDFRAIRDHYDGGLASLDAYLGQLFDELRAHGLWDEALVVVTSDHGESLGEAGRLGHGGLHLEEVLVPLIVKLPASWGVAPRRVAAPVELVDVLPTILDACRVPAPTELDGRSLLPLVSDGGAPAREHLVAQLGFREGLAGRTRLAKRALLVPGRWLVIHDLGGPLEAYDLEADPSGVAPLASPLPPEVARLAESLARYDRADTSRARGERELEMTDELREQLEALGYVVDGELDEELGGEVERELDGE